MRPSALVPNEPISHERNRDVSGIPIYGMASWGDLFTHRQQLASLLTLVKLVVGARRWRRPKHETCSRSLFAALALWSPRPDLAISLCYAGRDWLRSHVAHFRHGKHSDGLGFRRSESLLRMQLETGTSMSIEWVAQSDAKLKPRLTASAVKSSRLLPPLILFQMTSAHAFITDPPYYDAVPYADLSDYLLRLAAASPIKTSSGTLRALSVFRRTKRSVVDRLHELSNSNTTLRSTNEN